MDSLPQEILCVIFNRLQEDEPCVPRLASVSRSWHEAIRAVKSLTLVATERLKQRNLARVLQSFPVLERLVLVPSLKERTRITTLHEVARQFNGHPNLRVLSCPSDWVIPAILEGKCPRLKSLHLDRLFDLDERDGFADEDTASVSDGFSPGPEEVVERGSASRRNLGSLLQQCAAHLETVEIYQPTFWRRSLRHGRLDSLVGPSRLQSLSLEFISGWALRAFVDSLERSAGTGGSQAFALLKELKIEVLYIPLPGNTMTALSSACPRLETLEIRDAVVYESHLRDLASGCNHLKRLVLAHGSIMYPGYMGERTSYVHIVFYLTRHLPLLQDLHFLYTTLIDETQSQRTIPYRTPNKRHFPVHHPLQSLHLLDKGEYRPSTTEHRDLVTAFTQLKDLCVNIPLTSLLEQGSALWPRFSEQKHMRALELHCFSNSTTADMKWDESAHLMTLTGLESLTLWSLPISASTWITQNASTLKSLSLNYFPSMNEEGITFDLPHLQRLELRGLSTFSHESCLSAMRALTVTSRKLRLFLMKSLVREIQVFPEEDFLQLMERCPELVDVRFNNFRLPPLALEWLSEHPQTRSVVWPQLACFDISGPGALPRITQHWDQHHLTPFIATHSSLRRLALSTQGLEESEFPDLQVDPPVDLNESVSRLAVIERNHALYRSYSFHVLDRFFWLHTCHIN